VSTEISAFAKLTRTLEITGRRPDGYHLLRSEMVTLDFADDLTFVESPTSSLAVVDEIAWEDDSGSRPAAPESPVVPSDPTNLVLRALVLGGRTANVELVKRIPAGAGLGGGSADAAAALRYCGVTDRAAAATLGADVPFCLEGGRAAVSGVGDVIEPLAYLALEFVVVTPGFGVSTPAAYAAYDELGPGDGPNHLERAATAVEPRLTEVREVISSVAGERPVLAGSGSGAATTLRREIAEALRAEGIIASVVRCSSTRSHREARSGG
jgi:4-diphosphocytidyl-2-C-methyl-D-erythritol kinase